MLSMTRSLQRFLPKSRVAARLPSEPLDEFASEPPGPLSRRRPLVRRRMVAAAAAIGFVGVGLWSMTIREVPEGPIPTIAPAPSPVEVEYPEYPGAPLLQTATIAVPARLSSESLAEQVSNAAQAAPPRRHEPRLAAARAPADAEAHNAFDVRGAVPQLVSAVSAAAPRVGQLERSELADAPPRRIGPPLTLTALGGTATRNGRLALVLEVTEQGDVDRIVSHEAVDVHPDVLDSVSRAARGWRYEPARRDGVPVRARVRVVVELTASN